MPRSSRSRESGSRRSRSSSGRSRGRHRHDREHHHHRHGHHSINSHLRQLYRFRQKQKEKNFKAASCSMIAIVVLCTALSEPRWVSLRGGGCTIGSLQSTVSTPLDHLGAYQFFYPGSFYAENENEVSLYHFGPSSDDYMHNCVTYKAVVLMKVIITFTFIAMVCSLGGFLLDLIGPSRRVLKILRRNAILNIIAVIMCVIINMFCYWLTAEVQALQKHTKVHIGSKVNVNFDISFFLVAAAGAVGVLATALNCLRRYPAYDDSPSEALLDDFDGMEGLLAPEPDASPMANIPPPPAYTP
ncbi:transmembrane protein 127-like [Ylistrum balloti]|uniref:transmembrane protein 127-like n=1 Tax=Ylistrum balloti TaxID=509963 RepID=UPI002905BB7D|nr:transmembrane protein 127-like [Ylistrum balloti]